MLDPFEDLYRLLYEKLYGKRLNEISHIWYYVLVVEAYLRNHNINLGIIK